jgi:putative hemolysin
MISAPVEIAIILGLIFLNGVFAMTEMAVVSSRKARLQQRVNEGDDKAEAALKMANNPSDFLSTVQVGITVIGILAGAIGGATFAQTLGQWLAQFPVLAPFSGTIAFVLIVLLITFFTLIFGELVPKRIALNNPESIAIYMVAPMRFLTRLSSPVVRLLSFSTNTVLRILNVDRASDSAVTEEEVKVMIEQGTQAGVFEEAEQDMLEGVLRLADLRIELLITPRTEIEWLDLDSPVEENRKKVIESEHSIFPAAIESLDGVRGVVQAKELLSRYVQDGSFNILEHLREPVYVPQNMPALKVLELIKDTRVPMALVIDEYGGLQGLVTVNDILEAVVGDFRFRGPAEEPEIVQREDGSFLLDGMLNILEVKDLLNMADLPGEKEGYFQTLGGFVITFLGRIPTESDFFEWEGMRFEVVDMDGLRVDKVLVDAFPPADTHLLDEG